MNDDHADAIARLAARLGGGSEEPWKIAAIDTADLASLSTTTIAALSSWQTASLTTAQVHALTTGQVAAIETQDLAALTQAANATSGLKPIEAQARDLFRRPLLAEELKRIDAVVFDPPRQGAEAQSHELAKSKVSVIAAVSCNIATFARDARLLEVGEVLCVVDVSVGVEVRPADRKRQREKQFSLFAHGCLPCGDRA